MNVLAAGPQLKLEDAPAIAPTAPATDQSAATATPTPAATAEISQEARQAHLHAPKNQIRLRGGQVAHAPGRLFVPPGDTGGSGRQTLMPTDPSGTGSFGPQAGA